MEGEYKKALKSIVKRKDELNGDMRSASFLRDGGKVLSLRYTTSINQAIINGKSFEDDIVPLLHGLCFIFRTIITDPTDNHYLQVCINLKTSLEVAGHKMGDYRQKFEEWVQIFENKETEKVELDDTWIPQYSEDLRNRIAEVDHKDYENQWHDVYGDNNIGVVFDNFLGKLICYTLTYSSFHLLILRNV